MDESENTNTVQEKIEVIKFKDISMNILLGAMDCFEALKFDFLKAK